MYHFCFQSSQLRRLIVFNCGLSRALRHGFSLIVTTNLHFHLCESKQEGNDTKTAGISHTLLSCSLRDLYSCGIQVYTLMHSRLVSSAVLNLHTEQIKQIPCLSTLWIILNVIVQGPAEPVPLKNRLLCRQTGVVMSHFKLILKPIIQLSTSVTFCCFLKHSSLCFCLVLK